MSRILTLQFNSPSIYFRVLSGWDVIAVDYNESSLVRAQQLAARQGISDRQSFTSLNIDLEAEDEHALPRPNVCIPRSKRRCLGMPVALAPAIEQSNNESNAAADDPVLLDVTDSSVEPAPVSRCSSAFCKTLVQKATIADLHGVRVDLLHVARYLHRPLFPLLKEMVFSLVSLLLHPLLLLLLLPPLP